MERIILTERVRRVVKKGLMAVMIKRTLQMDKMIAKKKIKIIIKTGLVTMSKRITKITLTKMLKMISKVPKSINLAT